MAGEDTRDRTLVALEREVAILLRRARRVIALRAHVVHPDLHPAAYLMLATLIDRGSLRPSALADHFELDKGAVSRQVQQLVDLGLVSRDRDPEDGRASILTPTPEAVRGMADVVSERRGRLRERLEEWDEESLCGFVTSLGRYNEALEKPDEAR